MPPAWPLATPLLSNARGAAAQFSYTSYENTTLASRLKYDTRACNRLRYRGLVSSLQSASHKIYSVPHPRGSPSSLERHCGGRGGWGRLSALNCPQSSAWSSVCRRGVLPPANLTLSQETFPRLAQKTSLAGAVFSVHFSPSARSGRVALLRMFAPPARP